MESHTHLHHDEDMLSVERAKKRVLANFGVLDAEIVPVTQAIGQVLSNDIFSPLDIPPLNNSAMDCYAVIAVDTGSTGSLP